MILIAKKNQTWIDIVKSFGCNEELAKDIVQEMYIKIHLKIEKGLDIIYEDGVNDIYIYKTLRSLYFDLKRKGKNIKMLSIDDEENVLEIKAYDDNPNYEESYKDVCESLNNMYWYDRKVFEIINGQESIAALSRKSKIPYYSLYNTYNKVKSKLKKLLLIILILL